MTKTEETNFEKSMERLNTIAQKLESGGQSLEESLKLYEEGIQLAGICAKRLEDAGSRVEMLMRNSAGNLETSEVESEDLKPKKKKKKS